jgi:DNA-binding ferritin-like protein
MILYEHYKKDDWLLRDRGDAELRALLDAHAFEQRQLIEHTVDRVHMLGGVATVPREVGELTVISRPPTGPETVPAMLRRLVAAHEGVIGRIQDAISVAMQTGDETTGALLRDMLRRHEHQVWSIADQLVDSSALSA